jgi:tRNA pseudouridine55 synthase
MQEMKQPSGFLVLDKPSGPTSFGMVGKVRRALGVKKVGHLGTLDPLATGVLVLAVGQGTKLIEYFMKLDKVYEVELEFGKVSDTYDSEGEIEVVPNAILPEQSDVEAALTQFVGQIQQVPPAFSAIKVKGKRAYALARAGQAVELKARPVVIHSIKWRGFSGSRLSLEVHCGSGTYIRSLVHDLGQVLGCGAIMTDLRRTRVGEFSLSQAVDLDSIESGMIALETVVADWPHYILSESELKRLHNGQLIEAPQRVGSEESPYPRVCFYQDELVSLVEEDAGQFRVLKNFR